MSTASSVERLVEQYRILLAVSETIAARRDLEDMFEELAQRLPDIVPFDYINLVLHDPERDIMRLHLLMTPEPSTIRPGLELPVDESPGGWVWKHQQPLVVEEVHSETRFPTLMPLLRENGVQSFCAVPLTTALRRLGAMGFGTVHSTRYRDSDVEFMQQVAKQVAVAVDNALHHESALVSQEHLARERDRLRLLLEVSESIASHRDLGELLRDLAQRLPRLVPFDYINLLLHDPSRDVMRLHVLTAPEPSPFRAGMEWPVHESTAGWVWRSQEPLVVEDVTQDVRFPKLMALLREGGVQSFCAVPLTTALRRLGAMAFGSLRQTVYAAAEVDFMCQVAAQVAVAVDNVLHDESAQIAQQQLVRERDRVRLLLDVNNAVVSNLDLDQVFTQVSACLRQVIQHDGSSLVLWEEDTKLFRVHVLDFTKNTSSIEEGRMDSDCGRCPASIAVEAKKPVLFRESDLKDLADSSVVARRLLDEGVKSFCCTPLFSRNRALGALNVGRRGDDAFTDEEVELLGQVAQQIAIAVENALAYRQIAELKDKLAKEKLYLEDEIRTEYNFQEIIGESAALKRVLKQIEVVAPTDSTVLVQGETGTGKELVARAIHNLSSRRARTFVKMNCAAIPSGLLESELFGHERGAFTGAIAQKIGRFELADGGTLFLDEVGDIPLELQSKLLRVLQEKEFERLGSTKTIRVNVRLVAATNRDLSQMVNDKLFRSDLYFRLNVFPLSVPPLRERREDIPLLVRYFAQVFAQRMNKSIETIPVETMTALSQYRWPGNIRELENLIERAVILAQGSDLHVPLSELKAVSVPDSDGVATLEDAERAHILRALRDTNWIIGGQSGAAVKLGMKRTTLQSKMQKLGIMRSR